MNPLRRRSCALMRPAENDPLSWILALSQCQFSVSISLDLFISMYLFESDETGTVTLLSLLPGISQNKPTGHEFYASVPLQLYRTW